MTHLSLVDLTELLYDDGDSELLHGYRAHLEACPQCQADYDRLRQVADVMTLHAGDLPHSSIQPTRDLAHANSAGEAAGWPMRNSLQVPVALLVVAASIVLLVCGGAFAVGSSWQYRRISERIEAAIRSPEFARQIALSQQTSSDERIDALSDSVDQRLSKIASSLEEIKTTRVEVEASYRQRLETILASLAQNQVLLRKDLQTLALTAESEFVRAKHDIRNLSEFALAVRGGE